MCVKKREKIKKRDYLSVNFLLPISFLILDFFLKLFCKQKNSIAVIYATRMNPSFVPLIDSILQWFYSYTIGRTRKRERLSVT